MKKFIAFCILILLVISISKTTIRWKDKILIEYKGWIYA